MRKSTWTSSQIFGMKIPSFLESPHLFLISFCGRNQHFDKVCFTPHLLFIIVINAVAHMGYWKSMIATVDGRNHAPSISQWWLRRLLSYKEGSFSGAMLIFRRVIQYRGQLYYQPQQCATIVRIPQNYHTCVLSDPTRITAIIQ